MDALIEHFRDPERRKEFFKEYKEIEMLYEIISPDAFLRPFIDDYAHAVGHLCRGAQGLYQDASMSIGISRERPTNWCSSMSAQRLYTVCRPMCWRSMQTPSS